MPRRGGGGSTYESNMEINLDTTTSAKRKHSARFTNGEPSRPLPTSISVSSAFPATINTNYYQLDNFMWYDDRDELIMDGGWYVSSSLFFKNVPMPWPTVSSYNLLSIHAKSSAPVVLDAYFVSDDDKTSSGFRFGPLTGKWKRYDVDILTTSDWGDRLQSMYFEVYGPSSASIWIDETVLLDLRPGMDKNEWIALGITSQVTQNSTNMVNAAIAGNYGDLIFPNQSNNRRGTIAIKTHAPQDDADLSFIEGIKNSSGRCYLRAVGDGWPIYIESLNVGIRETVFGCLRDIQFTYIEESI